MISNIYFKNKKSVTVIKGQLNHLHLNTCLSNFYYIFLDGLPCGLEILNTVLLRLENFLHP